MRHLEFVADGRLFLFGGLAGRWHRVVLPGVPFAPAWSADHHWLAVEIVKPPRRASLSTPTFKNPRHCGWWVRRAPARGG